MFFFLGGGELVFCFGFVVVVVVFWLLNVPATYWRITGRICSDNWTCCHTEITEADQTGYLTKSPYIDTGTTSPTADPNSTRRLEGRVATGALDLQKDPWRERESNPGAGVMVADDHQVTTVFTVQPSFHHRHSTNRVSRSVTIVGERVVTRHLVVHRRW